MRSVFSFAVVGLVFIIEVAMCAVPASAGRFTLIKLGGGYMKWGPPELGAGATISYSFARAGMVFPKARNCGGITAPDRLIERSGLEPSDFEAAFRAAAAMWERAANLRFQYEEDPAKAEILIGAQTTPRGRAYANVEFDRGSGGSGLGLVTVVPRKTAEDFKLEQLPIQTLSRSLICLNPQTMWKVGFGGDMSRYDLRHTLAHELGHAIGLNHAGPSGQIMSFRYSEDRSDLQSGDVRGARLLYGEPAIRIATTGSPDPSPASQVAQTSPTE